MFCENCGKEIADEAKFCPKCGIATGEQGQIFFEKNTEGNEKKSAFRKVSWVIAVAVVLVPYILFAVKETPQKLVLGEWYGEDFQITFDEDGTVVIGDGYGCFVYYWKIDSNKTLTMEETTLQTIRLYWDSKGKCEYDEQWYVDKEKLICGGEYYYRTKENLIKNRDRIRL